MGAEKIYLGFSFLGISFTIVPAVLWPMVSICAPSDIIGLAYGLIHAAGDLLQLLSTVFFGYLVDTGISYAPSLFLILASLTIIGIVFSILLVLEKRKEWISRGRRKNTGGNSF